MLHLLAILPASASLDIVTTTTDLAAITRAVGGDDVTVTHIARGDLDPHFVDAKPSYMLKLANADLVIAVGMDLEAAWLPSLLTGARNPHVQPGTPGYLDASRYIVPIEVPIGTIDRSRGDLHPAGNPHYWLDPENGRRLARGIAGRLAELDPEHAPLFEQNLAAFEAALTARQAEWTAKMAPLHGSTVVGYHMTFDYFFRAYGLKVVGFVEPKPGIPPTPTHTIELGEVARATKVRFVCVEPYHDPRDAGPIAKASGATVVTLPTSVGSVEGADDYLALFDVLVARLAGSP